MIAAPGKGGIHADDRVGNGGISGRSKKPEKCKSRSGSSAESAGDMSTGEIMRDANSCTMCKRMIINAGISQVIIRRDNDTYDTIDVADWVAHDDVLDGQTGY